MLGAADCFGALASSLMYMLKWVRLKLHPCLTLRLWGRKCVCFLQILTVHLLFVYVELMRSWVFPPQHHFLTVYTADPWNKWNQRLFLEMVYDHTEDFPKVAVDSDPTVVTGVKFVYTVLGQRCQFWFQILGKILELRAKFKSFSVVYWSLTQTSCNSLHVVHCFVHYIKSIIWSPAVMKNKKLCESWPAPVDA